MTRAQEVLEAIKREAGYQKEKGLAGWRYGYWRVLWGTVVKDKDDPRVQALEDYRQARGDGSFFSWCDELVKDLLVDKALSGPERKEAVIERLYRSI